MDIFEQIGKKVSNAGKGVSQQAKTLADIAKLNNEISDGEKRIYQLYTQIGEAYYNQHKNDASAEFRTMLDELNAIFARNSELTEQVQKLKGIGKCPTCGANVPTGTAFCPSCGARLERDTSAAEKRFCPKCGTAHDVGSKFCSSCGTAIS